MTRERQPAVYLLVSKRNGTLYCGVTSNLMQRIAQHREGSFSSFTDEYAVHRLVWFEAHETMDPAIDREKRMKEMEPRVETRANRGREPALVDLAEQFGFDPP